MTYEMDEVRREIYEQMCQRQGVEPYPQEGQKLPSKEQLEAHLEECRRQGLLSNPMVAQLLEWLALENRALHRQAIRTAVDLFLENYRLEKKVQLLSQELSGSDNPSP